MKLDNVTRLKGQTRDTMGFSSGPCNPVTDPFDVSRDKELHQMSPVNPKYYFWLEVYRGKEKEFWASDRTVWTKVKSLAEAKKFSGYDQAVKNWKAREAEFAKTSRDNNTRQLAAQVASAHTLDPDQREAIMNIIAGGGSKKVNVPGVETETEGEGDGTQDF